MSIDHELLQSFCEAINPIKRIALSTATVSPEHYLGGDLGIDSVEMLEVWFRIEKVFGLQISDVNKRDIYTVGEVIDVIKRQMSTVSDLGSV